MKKLSCVELFAGAGGMALGMERAGFEVAALIDNDPYACSTLMANRPEWSVVQKDVSNIDYRGYAWVNLVCGGYPCQSWSTAGKRKGFEDPRGQLCFEMSRAVGEIMPEAFVAENVENLARHDGGRTLEKILSSIPEGYTVSHKVLNAADHGVPQKRKRLFIVGFLKIDDFDRFRWPEIPVAGCMPYTMADALKADGIYKNDCPDSPGAQYPSRKKSFLELVPPGGCWRDLPDGIREAYMGNSLKQGGGKTGMARRLSWDEPCLTLTCSPAQRQTERCHPDETRPLTVREYARVQTFPDDWEFVGPVGEQYRQIGNAVPCLLAKAIGKELKKTLED